MRTRMAKKNPVMVPSAARRPRQPAAARKSSTPANTAQVR
jgi:hypothetical protein